MYVVVEMQNGIIGGNTWTYETRADAEVKLYQVLSEVVKSPVKTHTVMLVTDEGFPLDTKCYKHEVKPEPVEPETEPDAQEDEEIPSESPTELESMTKTQLIEYANEHGVDVSSSMTKAEIISAIENA